MFVNSGKIRLVQAGRKAINCNHCHATLWHFRALNVAFRPAHVLWKPAVTTFRGQEGGAGEE